MAVSKWFTALEREGLTVHSARDAVTVPGWLDTGNYALNWAISGRFGLGYPLGHAVEIFGDPSTGKSFLVARAIAMVQAQKGVALLDDTEGAYNLDWLQKLGVNVDHLAYQHSRTVNDHLAVAQAFLKAYRSGDVKGPGLLACDSLAALSTEHELEVGLDKRDMTKAGELKAFFRIVGGDLSGLTVVHLSANHTIANIGDFFHKRTTPGGGGPKFHASVRVDLCGISKIKMGPDYVGVLCLVVIDKNRLAPPWKKIRLAIPFERPISRASGLIPVLIDLGVLEASGQFLRYQGKKLGLRVFKSKEHALKQDEEAERLLDQIPELLEEVDEQLKSGTPSRGDFQQEVEDAEDT